MLLAGANISQRQQACNSSKRVQPMNCKIEGDEMVFQVIKLSHRLKVKDREDDEKRHTMNLRLSRQTIKICQKMVLALIN
nr:hypothetical protein [Tanacetum cinerariifolium]